MLDTRDILETIDMIQHDNLDIRTVTMGISLLDCIDSDIDVACGKVYEKITRLAKDLVPVCESIEKELGIPIINKRISVTPIAMIAAACRSKDVVKFALTLEKAAKTVGVNFIGGYSALVQKGFAAGDRELIESIPEALSVTEHICSSVNIGSTKAGINMDAVLMAAQETDLGPRSGGDLIKHQVHTPIINEFVGDIFFIGGKAGLHALGILIGLIRAFLRGGVILGNPYTTILGAVINNHRAAGDQQPVAIGKPLHGGGRHILIPKNPNITADGLLSLIEGSFVEPYIVIVSLALALFSLQVLHDLSIWRPDGLPVVVFPMQIAYRSTIDHLTGLGIGIPAIYQVTAAIAGNAGHRQVFIGGAGDKLIIELRKIRLLWLWVRLRLRLWLRQNIDVPLRTAGRQ